MKYLWVTLKGKVRITSPFYMTISMVIGGIFLPLYGCIGRALHCRYPDTQQNPLPYKLIILYVLLKANPPQFLP
jgi:hypothetical protein